MTIQESSDFDDYFINNDCERQITKTSDEEN